MDNDKVISDTIESWNLRKKQLTGLYRNREKSAVSELMNEAIDEFLTLLFLINDTQFHSQVNLYEDLQRLDYKPMNFDERISFILEKPNQYHSFVQLNELYHELLKRHAKMKMVRNKK